jgi:hypothetical protein
MQYLGAECVIHLTLRVTRSLFKAVQNQKPWKCTNSDQHKAFESTANQQS